MQSVDCPFFLKLSRRMIGIISKKTSGPENIRSAWD